MSEYDSLPGFNDPEWVWIPSIAPSGMDFYSVAIDEKMMFPDLKGRLLVGSLKFRRLYSISINEDGLPESESILIDGTLGRICLLYTSPSPRDLSTSRMPSSA